MVLLDISPKMMNVPCLAARRWGDVRDVHRFALPRHLGKAMEQESCDQTQEVGVRGPLVDLVKDLAHRIRMYAILMVTFTISIPHSC